METNMVNTWATLPTIDYKRLDLYKGGVMMNQLVACYRAVFADEPWNEWKICPVCKKKWGIKQVPELEKSGYVHCDKVVEDFWPRDIVRADIQNEISREASCWIAHHNESVIGFCWGYPISLDKLEEKLKLPGFATNAKRSGFPDEVAYHDEIGVKKEYRMHGIAKNMFQLSFKDFREKGLSAIVARTMSSPPTIAYYWFKKIGYKVIDRYDRHNDKDSRVILACSTDNLS